MRFLALLAALVIVAATPAAPQQRLVPEEKTFPILEKYKERVRQVLKEAFAPEVKLSAIVHPAFTPEYAVGLRGRGRRHYIFAVHPSQSVWTYTWVEVMREGRAGVMSLDGKDQTSSEIERLTAALPADPSDLLLSRCEAPADEELAVSITSAWKNMLEEVRPGEEQLTGTDGVTYHFSMESDGRLLAGQIWSPDGNTRPAWLAKMADTMRSYCQKPGPKYLRRIISLARKMTEGDHGRGRR
jgi:hypothetical protein